MNAERDESKFIQDIVETIADIKEPLMQVVTTSMKENQRRHELQVKIYYLCLLSSFSFSSTLYFNK